MLMMTILKQKITKTAGIDLGVKLAMIVAIIWNFTKVSVAKVGVAEEEVREEETGVSKKEAGVFNLKNN